MDRKRHMSSDEYNAAKRMESGDEEQENFPTEETGAESGSVDSQGGEGCQENVGENIAEYGTGDYPQNFGAGDETEDRMSLYDNVVPPPDANQQVEPLFSAFILHKEEANDVATFLDPNPGDFFSSDEISQLVNGYGNINPYEMLQDSNNNIESDVPFDESGTSSRFVLDPYGGKRCSPVLELDENEHHTELEIQTKRNIVQALQESKANVDMALKELYEEMYNNIQILGVEDILGPGATGMEGLYLEVNVEGSEGYASEEEMDSVDTLADAFQNWSTDLHADGRNEQQADNHAESTETIFPGDEEMDYENAYAGHQQLFGAGTAPSYGLAQSTEVVNGNANSAQSAESASTNSTSEEQKKSEDDVKREKSGDDSKSGKQEGTKDSGEEFKKFPKSRPRRSNRRNFQQLNCPHGMKVPKKLFSHLIDPTKLQLKQTKKDVHLSEKQPKTLGAKKRFLRAWKKMQIMNRGGSVTKTGKLKYRKDVDVEADIPRLSPRHKSPEHERSEWISEYSSSLIGFEEERDNYELIFLHQDAQASDAGFREHMIAEGGYYGMQEDYLPNVIRGADNNINIIHCCTENLIRDVIAEEMLAKLGDKRPILWNA